MVLGHHIIHTGYGHWLPNDVRGSYSTEVFSPELKPLAEVHFGRKRIQPSREELRAFLREAEKHLAHPVLWWGDREQSIIAQSIEQYMRDNRLTCYAFAILHNHVHLLIRRHAKAGQVMLAETREIIRAAIRDAHLAPPGHPVLSEGGAVWFKDTVPQMWACEEYVRINPQKHGMPPQEYPFVTPYDGWPHRDNA